MSNQIDMMNQTNLQVSSGASRSSVGLGEAGANQAGTDAPATGDTIELTDLAKRLQFLQASIADLPEVDSGRVEAMRQSLISGDYQIDARSVADQIIALDQGMPLEA